MIAAREFEHLAPSEMRVLSRLIWEQELRLGKQEGPPRGSPSIVVTDQPVRVQPRRSRVAGAPQQRRSAEP